jgi:3-mercaptopyruvate sulfurtransferase SseA
MSKCFLLCYTILSCALLLPACQATSEQSAAATSNQAQTQPTRVAAPTTVAPPTMPPTDGAQRITPNELKQALAKGTAIVIDVRGEGYYKMGHVQGALWIPESEIVKRMGELPRNKTIVTYCS